ncbi:MAG TPA: site-2 protease family protein [Thermotogota bacterium]|jgi:Zn-dependent protease|nr:site-2 protease family protein [Thermotogota bacterium]HOD90871.1 site-2 protease family protein [Thermotogota bacterium]HOF23522.1 site-2 protease family protein [Thermotogota bacterium]HOM55682.1 site-2 protease family protein [Thermotogota bacterium]HOS24818.1 site-2 protease family protein [Thermotogota bacterium]
MFFGEPFEWIRFLRAFVTRIPAVIFALGLHEWAHARAAVARGDTTPILLGRATPNPLKHLDPIGLTVFFLFGYGWSRPIPINPVKLKKKRDILVIAFAGPLFSLVLGFITGLVYYSFGLHRYSYFFNPEASQGTILTRYLSDLMGFFMVSNFVIFIFNLFPIMPLDAANLWMTLYTSKHMKKVIGYQVYGIVILLFLVVSGLAGIIMNPVVDFFRLLLIQTSMIWP